MMNGLARVALMTYRGLGVCAYPVVSPYLLWRAAKGKEDRRRKSERFGYAGVARPQGPLIWIHAASVGEMLSVIALVRELRRLDIAVLLTTGTITSARIAAERLGGDVIHQYAPLDLKPAVSRFLDYWHPDVALTAESEIWPATMAELEARHIAQVRVNARLSDRSFARWSRHQPMAELLFSKLSLVVAQSDLDGERYRDLGAWPVVVSGNLKGDSDPLPVDEGELQKYRRQIGQRKTWAATSTFEGEEKAAAMVHRALKAHNDQLTIIVPRHPERADAIEAMLVEKELKVARRSRGDVITAETDVFLGDTIGEMGLYLRLTDLVFVGRSLMTETGGQNPMEPAALGCAILSGPHVENFREAYQKLVRNGGARIVKDVEVLAKAVHYLLTNDMARLRMIDASQATVQDMRGALSATLRALEPYINPLAMKARLEPRAAAQ
ncbi:lipid IV(A) 3-deoxy-D-manno-octulosonic acid transferase [Rhizobiaceae bacterium BDR2-2]|uniref:3-deoxy-D-manno-octulosonic acid transferase n=1 Tax=Ectorhizobium quercum TaxID=2965071 RepID=A0AAE3N2C1_9HYPH|nr:lipid IV(A) 3-deoxy-D-manno-octulosonic acid transferase [Ectorhizobium quercum]MCX8996305.1 lipid IV(A) 3-deoxy-D-manno-octulosonic acid transferase [Ectorhizobium quercum]MCX8998656.1 lipid IV(A) 3-deoxy-D-manno-octulosonic acid transferase [Ectorhizobium quercum]